MEDATNAKRSAAVALEEAAHARAARIPRPARSALVAGCLILAAGCASAKVTTQPVATGPLPRPGKVWVYDFAATAADVPAESALSGEISHNTNDQTPDEMELGHKLGALIATELVAHILEMGMPAEHGLTGSTPEIDDIVIRGALVSFDEGDAKKRVRIGFGAGASELQVAAEGFQVTADGMRKLGSGTSDATGGKSPGAALGVVGLIATRNPAGLLISGATKLYGESSGSSKVEGRARDTAREIAGALKRRFEEQGWVR